MDQPDSVRAPLRAHILASINPFSGASAAPASLESRPRGKRSRKRVTAGSGTDKDRDKDGEENIGGDDDEKLRPRVSKIRFKSRRERRADEETEESDDRRRYRSRDYEDPDGDGEIGKDDKDKDEKIHPKHKETVRGHEDCSPKEGSTRRSRDSAPDMGDEQAPSPRHRHDRHRHHRHHHRRHRRPEEVRSPSPTRTRSASPSEDRHRHDRRSHRRHRSHRKHKEDAGIEREEEDPYADPPLDPDAAFRQSLFDAMADDEGAAYWEAVYGQPVHEYAEEAAKQRAADARGAQDPAGLSAMNDEEYATYVRRRMWERSDEGRREAAAKERQARKEREKERDERAAKERAERASRERAKKTDTQYWAEVDRSLRRGEARRQRKRWLEQWQAYTEAWTQWERSPSAQTIPWPVRFGTTEADGKDGKDGKDDKDKAGEDYAKEVLAFFTGGDDDEATGKGLQTRLRDERVRWHPDKMQQRLGGSVDAGIMRRITSIFQEVDRLWGELRKK